jgi:hypothetical protein
MIKIYEIESPLRGTLIEKQRSIEVAHSIQQLEAYQQTAQQINVPLQVYMGGNSHVHEGGGKIDFMRAVRSTGASTIGTILTFAKTISIPGIDYSVLWGDPRRVKYYCSFYEDITTTQQDAFVADLVVAAQKRGLSIQLKTQDHNYDGLLVYSWDVRMATLLNELYSAYSSMFQSVPRIYQQEISSESIGCIGWVLEPLAPAYVSKEVSTNMGSHSVRMLKLGERIGTQSITPELYKSLCSEIGIRPEKPHIIASDRLQAS